MTRTRSSRLSPEREPELPAPAQRTQTIGSEVDRETTPTVRKPEATKAIDPAFLDWEYDATLAGRTNYIDEAIEEMIEFEDALTTRRSNLKQAPPASKLAQSMTNSDHSSKQVTRKKPSHTTETITYDSLNRDAVVQRNALRVGVRQIFETTDIDVELATVLFSSITDSAIWDLMSGDLSTQSNFYKET